MQGSPLLLHLVDQLTNRKNSEGLTFSEFSFLISNLRVLIPDFQCVAGRMTFEQLLGCSEGEQVAAMVSRLIFSLAKLPAQRRRFVGQLL